MENPPAIRQILAAYLQRLDDTLSIWEGETKSLDLCETDYAENYAGANAAVLLAYDFRITQNPRRLVQLDGLMRRILVLLSDRQTRQFCKTFLFHYSLLALILLPPKEQKELMQRLDGLFAFRDECPVINVNCAAMQLGSSAFLCALGQGGLEQAKEKIRFIAAGENGFINDAIGSDGMPVAYHAFIVYLLCEASWAMEQAGVLAALQRQVVSLIASGTRWLLLAEDEGQLPMTGRSRHQCFVPGILAAVHAYSGLEGVDLSYFREYRKQDGSFSCTPNYFDNNLRVGFESYTRENMYNHLAMTGLCLADLWGDRRSFAGQASASVCFCDEESGYGFFRKTPPPPPGCIPGIVLLSLPFRCGTTTPAIFPPLPVSTTESARPRSRWQKAISRPAYLKGSSSTTAKTLPAFWAQIPTVKLSNGKAVFASSTKIRAFW